MTCSQSNPFVPISLRFLPETDHTARNKPGQTCLPADFHRKHHIRAHYPLEAGSMNYYPTSISGTSSFQGTYSAHGSQTIFSGSGGGLGFSQRSRCFRMRLMTNGCSMKQMTFICPPHFGHFNALTPQTFFRSTAHTCRMRLEYAERSFIEEAGTSSVAAAGKISWRRSRPRHAWL